MRPSSTRSTGRRAPVPTTRRPTSALPSSAASPTPPLRNGFAYANEWVAAKEVTVLPGQSYELKDSACYCRIVTQGHGHLRQVRMPGSRAGRYEDLTADEFFVSEATAKKGVKIVNGSSYEPLVILQNFANNNPEVPATV